MKIEELEELFNQFNDLHVVVIGDLMLDKYHWGAVERISPEAPVPVVNITSKEIRLGGAANVALNCRRLGAKVTIASVIGEDEDAEILIQLLKDQDIATSHIHKSPYRPTTSKTRIISRNQQMIRFDEEISDDLNIKEEHPFIDSTLKLLQIQKPDLVIFEDYNKGVLKANVIDKIMTHCKNIGIVTAVDPKAKNFLNYKHVDIFKPNLKEVREALNLQITEVNEHSLTPVHEQLMHHLDHHITFITLADKGVFAHDENRGFVKPCFVRNIADVSGAGDTVIAVASMTYVLTRNVLLMAQLSNLAGGLVCEEVGVVPIDKNLLYEQALAELLNNNTY